VRGARPRRAAAPRRRVPPHAARARRPARRADGRLHRMGAARASPGRRRPVGGRGADRGGLPPLQRPPRRRRLDRSRGGGHRRGRLREPRRGAQRVL
ncbi:MAG: hypothetical protein AVDCRST_MAG11-2837, partial [uncultured Gemmatimonadaceae bacterium]